MGMGIEQYVYAVLGYPLLSIVGPVSSTLSRSTPPPAWINRNATKGEAPSDSQMSARILMKGPCDMCGIADFIGSRKIDTEFFYVDQYGRQVENQTHIVNILNALLSDDDKKMLLSYNVFSVDDLFETKLFTEHYSVVILSMVSFYNFGVYRHKKTGSRYAAGQNCWDLTDPANWDGYINGTYYNGKFQLHKSDLERFSSDFEKIDYDREDIIADLKTLCDAAKAEKIILILGNDKVNVKHPGENYVDREKKYREFNERIKARISEFRNLELLDVSQFITSDKDLLDSINHYSRRVLYSISTELVKRIEANTAQKVTNSPIVSFIKRIKRKLKI